MYRPRLCQSSRPATPAFTRPTLQRFVLLIRAALLWTGRRTVANLLRIAAPLADGHVTSYRRVFSSASWSAMRLACGLCRLVVRPLPPDRPIPPAGDDTGDGHPSRRVYGQARHRDPVRSSHSYTAGRSGHKWVVLALPVRCPFATRAWALPGLVGWYRPEQDDRARGRPHRTPAQIMCQRLRVLRRWFPDRRLIFVGDAGYGTHEVARFCHRHRLGRTLVSKLHPDAHLFELPSPSNGKGRPRVKGAVRWVFVRDRDGPHRDEFCFSTDPSLDPVLIIGIYTARWDLETTFQGLRAWLGSETTRGWYRKTVLRMAPCRFGLSTRWRCRTRHCPSRSGPAGWRGPGSRG